MPNVTLHLLLAERVLDAWACGGTGPSRFRAGVPPHLRDAPELRQAFLLGALGPDLGYFPGGQPLLSDLAHCVQSGTLARQVLRQAETPREQAFALGWVTHVIADRRLHPVVGSGVADVRKRWRAEEGGVARPAFVSADADPEGHVRVETGIDAWISGVHPSLRRRRFTPIFDAASIGFLVRAYRATYGVEFAPRDFLTSHQASARMATRALVAIGLLSSGWERPSTLLGTATVSLAAATARWLGRGKLAVAFLSPAPPPPWLRIAVAEEVLGFVPRVEAALEDPEAGLPDVNLDTGHPDGTDPDHRTTRNTLQALAMLRVPSAVPSRARVSGLEPVTPGAIQA